jgi:4-amino-4-deoxy-L-arabinose transferase-like glycosyltransferase
LILPTVIAIFLIFWNVKSLGLSHWDEYNYILTAKWFLNLEDGVFTIYEPPGFPFFTALFFKTFGIYDYVAIATSSFFAVMTVVLLTVIGVKFFGLEVGVEAPILLTISALFLTYSRMALTDMMFTFFFTAATFSMYTSLKSGKHRELIFAGILLAACVAVKYNGFMPLIIAICYIPIMLKSINKNKRIREIFRYLRSILIIIVPTVVFAVLFLSLLGIEGSLGDLTSLKTVKMLTVALPNTFLKGFNEFQVAVEAHGGQLNFVPFIEAPFYLNVLIRWIPIPILIFTVIGLMTRNFKESTELYTVIWLVLTFILVSSVPVSYPRAILPLLPPLSLLSALGIKKVRIFLFSLRRCSSKKILLDYRIKASFSVIIMILIIALNVPAMINTLSVNHNAYRKAGEILKLEAGNADILAEAQPVIAFYYSINLGEIDSEQIVKADFLIIDFIARMYDHHHIIYILENEDRIEVVASIRNDVPDIVYLNWVNFDQLSQIKDDANYTTIKIYRVK